MSLSKYFSCFHSMYVLIVKHLNVLKPTLLCVSQLLIFFPIFPSLHSFLSLDVKLFRFNLTKMKIKKKCTFTLLIFFQYFQTGIHSCHWLSTTILQQSKQWIYKHNQNKTIEERKNTFETMDLQTITNILSKKKTIQLIYLQTTQK